MRKRIVVGETYITKSAQLVDIVHVSKKGGYLLGIVQDKDETQVQYARNGTVFGDTSNSSPYAITKPLRDRMELWLCRKADGSLLGPACSPVSWNDHETALRRNKARVANEGAKLVLMREV